MTSNTSLQLNIEVQIPSQDYPFQMINNLKYVEHSLALELSHIHSVQLPVKATDVARAIKADSPSSGLPLHSAEVAYEQIYFR